MSEVNKAATNKIESLQHSVPQENTPSSSLKLTPALIPQKAEKPLSERSIRVINTPNELGAIFRREINKQPS